MRVSVIELLRDLSSATNTETSTALFNRVTYVLTHTYDSSEEERRSVACAAKTCHGLTEIQKNVFLPVFLDYGEEGEGCSIFIPFTFKLTDILRQLNQQ